MKKIGYGLIGAVAVVNPWTLSIVIPNDGFYFFGILEKSNGEWGLASILLILAADAGMVVIGCWCLRFAANIRKGIYVAITVSLSFLLSFALLEVIARILTPANIFSPYVQLRPYNKMELHVSLNGVSPSARNSTNRWGLRGDDPPAEWKEYHTIVAIGGSTTQCFYLDDAKTWPYLLQLKLQKCRIKAWVGNAGVSGHSTRAHLLFAREILPKIHPEVALVLCGINDLWYSLDDHSKNIETTPEKVGWKHKVLGFSRLVQIVFLWKIILWDRTVVLGRTANANFTYTPLKNELKLSGSPEEILPSLVSYRTNLHSLIEEFRRQRIQPVFITQPVLYDTTSYWKKFNGWEYNFNNRKGELSAATYASMVFQFNETLRNVCGEQHVELIDAEKEIPHTTEYFYDLMHFTELGAQRLADIVAERMVHDHP